ncbi:9430_t:CDS:2 [Acaulospora morrowiae]|uniref:Copper transport protein n=1 Tax=Acaulospora morrowiae TaxID=94023 RepID=A0A9N9C3Q5_9GLOM|nr:9430_t:CDS:2 [Acaulospora morrowiae]
MSETMSKDTEDMDYFNGDFSNVVVLFKGFTISTIPSFILACLFIITLCWFERLLSYVLEKYKYDINRSRNRSVLIRTAGYLVATILRLFYMLITMTMNTQLFIVVVVGLATGQLITEYLRSIPIYSSTHTLENHLPISRFDHKDDDDDLPSENTLGDDSVNEKIIGYTDDFVISNIHSEGENDDDDDE